MRNFLFVCCSVWASTRDDSFTRLYPLVESPSHLWLLKQFDQYVLELEASFNESAIEFIQAMEHVVSAVLRGESARDARNLAGLMGPDRKVAETMNDEILSMGALIKGNIGLNIFEFPGFEHGPMWRDLLDLMAVGQTAEEMVSFLAIVVNLSTFEIELVIDAFRRLSDIRDQLTLTHGVDVGFGFPEYHALRTVVELDTGAMRVNLEKDLRALMKNIDKELSLDLDWAHLWSDPALVDMRVIYPMETVVVSLPFRIFYSRFNPAHRETTADLKALFEMYASRRAALTESAHERFKAIMTSLARSEPMSEGFRWTIARGIDELRARISADNQMQPESILDSFPMNSAVLVRVKSWLGLIHRYRSHLDVEPDELVAFRRGLVSAVSNYIKNLTPFQHIWLENYLRSMIHSTKNSPSILGTRLGLSKVGLVAYELAAMCGIKLLVHYKPSILSETELTLFRRIISNLVFTQPIGRRSVITAVLRGFELADSPKRKLIADAWLVYTIGRKEFENRPIQSANLGISDGRELAFTGYLPDFLINEAYDTGFIPLMSEFKGAICASAIFRSILPENLNNLVARGASPAEAFGELVKRYESLGRNKKLPSKLRVYLRQIPRYMFLVFAVQGLMSGAEHVAARSGFQDLADTIADFLEMYKSDGSVQVNRAIIGLEIIMEQFKLRPSDPFGIRWTRPLETIKAAIDNLVSSSNKA